MTTLVKEAVERLKIAFWASLTNANAGMKWLDHDSMEEMISAAWSGFEEPAMSALLTSLPTDVASEVAGDGPRSCSSDAGLDRAGDDHSAAACSSDGLGPLGRLHYNLACAPPDAEKCFVSLDDHRAIIAAFDALPTDDDDTVERVYRKGWNTGYNANTAGWKNVDEVIDESWIIDREAIHTLIGREG